MRHILIAQPEFLGSKQQRRPGGAQVFADQPAAVLQPSNRMLDRAGADGGSADYERAIATASARVGNSRARSRI